MEYLRLDWDIIGIIFSIMLLPFVLTQIPLGFLADKKFGEKEILSIGFVIISIFTVSISFINNINIFLTLAFILFMTRVGAAMVELMNDTYFFKQINDDDLNIINLYRVATPLAYIISPILATIVLIFVPFKFIFLILGLIMILGLKCSLSIKDTR
jgi:MFS family permease